MEKISVSSSPPTILTDILKNIVKCFENKDFILLSINNGGCFYNILSFKYRLNIFHDKVDMREFAVCNILSSMQRMNVLPQEVAALPS